MNIKKFFKAKFKKKKVLIVFKLVAAAFILLVSPIAGTQMAYKGKVYPNIKVAGVNVGGKSSIEGRKLLSEAIKVPDQITVTFNSQNYNINVGESVISYDLESSINSAYGVYRSGSVVDRFVYPLVSLFRPVSLPLQINLNKDELQKRLYDTLKIAVTEPVYPSVELVSGNIEIHKGSPGYSIDYDKLKNDIAINISENNLTKVDVESININPTLTDEASEIFKNEAKRYLGKSLKISYGSYEKVIKDKDILSYLLPSNTFNEGKIKVLSLEIKSSVDAPPQNSVLVFNDEKVSEFKASKDGLDVNLDGLTVNILNGLRALATAETEVAVEIPVQTTPPEISLDKVNNLGINELIGKGSSKFAHSIASRIYNVGLASSKFNGILVKPGETFSFNEKLGDVSKYTGYKQAYVIRDGRTILGDGGGVCQVSTTLFRALLNAGLPILERKSHSYRVGYYEQDSPPGLDATVFSPSPDLKFVNDTPQHLLIQTIYDAKKLTLVFEIYGTNDGRIATVSKPKFLSQTPPPEDLYIDDPTLPLGKVNQIEHKAWGAKVSFDYHVERNGEVLTDKTFISNYQPWQAVYMRGTGPAQ